MRSIVTAFFCSALPNLSIRYLVVMTHSMGDITANSSQGPIHLVVRDCDFPLGILSVNT